MLGVIFIWGIGPILDVALGESKNPRPPRESGTPFEALLWVHGLLHFVMLGTFFVFAASEGMTRDAYAKKIVPIAALFATSLWASNTAYVYLSVAFIQMLKALSPVTVYSIGCAIGIEQYTHRGC